MCLLCELYDEKYGRKKERLNKYKKFVVEIK